VNKPDSLLLERLAEHVLICDGAMGTSLHALNLPLSDYRGLENCSEILVETRPDVVAGIHRAYLEVGCDAVETNTFGANRVVLAEFGLADRTYELNRQAAQLARRVADEFSTPDWPRFVFGSVGPGTKLISLRQIDYDELLASYREQARGLLDGGVDALLIETCQDILQAKTAIHAARLAFDDTRRRVPLMCQVTLETTGTLLVGTDIAAAVVALEAFPEVAVIGLNCGTGPAEMSEAVRYLSKYCARLLSVQPNAGLPQVVNGQPRFPLTPRELARWLREFVAVDGVNLVGGCCGTTPEHLAAVVKAVRRLRPGRRDVSHEPAVSSLYQAVPVRQETSFLIIGERCNTNGSRQFKRLLIEGDDDGLVAMAREQVQEGAHVLDVCVDCVGRDGVRDMERVVRRLASEVTAPLMLDSTEPPVLEAGLKLAPGKCIVNSVHLEDGEERLARVCRLVRQFGAAVVALTIDDDPTEAMAKTAARKIAVATRLYDLLTRKYGIVEEDIFFDCLTFPITTGNAADRRLALETLDAIEHLRREFPRCQFLLGISNVSFGLSPAARVVLNSAFLHEACQRGLTAAIVHAGRILPRNRISDERWQAALDLIYDRSAGGTNPLERFIGLFSTDEEITPRVPLTDLPVEERLRRRIIDGNRAGLEADLDEALQRYRALEIVNDILLAGMKTVGDLFGAGQMQLPFVLKSAETMKAAVAYLEPHMERTTGPQRGTLVLATVRGDVHDIGKNLVDIILTNNGYTVYNLGIKQPIANVIRAWREHRADAIGLSGLLVKSTLVMRDDLLVLNEQGITVPVILGGAALTRRYVEEELRPLYRGPVYYAGDAFDGLHLIEQIVAGREPARVPAVTEPVLAEPVPAAAPAGPSGTAAPAATATSVATSPAATGAAPEAPADTMPPAEPPRSDIRYEHPVPQPPFWGARVVESIDPRAALAFINETMLFQVQWGFRRKRRSAAEWRRYVDTEIRPLYRALLERCEREHILQPQAIYGYWPCNSDGDDLIIYAPPPSSADVPVPGAPPPPDRPSVLSPHALRPQACTEIARFRFPRQNKPPYWCLSDFWRPVAGGVVDVVAFSLVTVGRRVTAVAREYFARVEYQQYLLLHGLGVELAEALAEYIHKQIRIELDIADRDARDLRKLFQQGYQGSRYSFGYPACPRLEDQALLLKLLGAERIGVSLTDGYMLDPEQSTSAIVTYHPQARYFSVR